MQQHTSHREQQDQEQAVRGGSMHDIDELSLPIRKTMAVDTCRTLVLSSQAEHEALRQARQRIATEEGKTEYQRRAGIEGALSQGVRRSGMRRSRYWGLAKTHLQHVATVAALNIGRVVTHWEGHKPAKTQISRLARSRPVEIMVA
jgi:transposase